MALCPIYHLDLCAGSGMLGVALKLALGGSLRTVCYCEREAYAAAALVARMEDEALDRAPVWDDVATLTEPEPLEYLGQFHPLVVSGGYPCQPFSLAGRRASTNDDRHLWPAIDRLVGALSPLACFFENVPGHVSLGYAQVRRDLEGRGYRVKAGIFSAAEVGANHRRERLFILALRRMGHTEGQCGEVRSESTGLVWTSPVDGAGDQLADSLGPREPQSQGSEREERRRFGNIGYDLADSQNPNGRGELKTPGEGIGRSGFAGGGQDVADTAGGYGQAGGHGARRKGGAAFAKGSSILADTGTTGLSRAESPALCAAGRREKGGTVGELCRPQLSDAETVLGQTEQRREPDGILSQDVPLFAPGPGDREAWRDIHEINPGLAPAIEPRVYRTADGVAYKLDADRLRLTGNGVVPLAAAYAFVSLYAALQAPERGLTP